MSFLSVYLAMFGLCSSAPSAPVSDRILNSVALSSEAAEIILSTSSGFGINGIGAFLL